MELDSVDSALLGLETTTSNFIINVGHQKESLAEITKIECEISRLQKEIRVLTPKYETLKDDLRAETEENEVLKKKHNTLQEQVVNIEKKCSDLRSALVIRSSDNLKMIKAKELLNIGKTLTGIRWDFSAPDDINKGYIANASNGVLKPFEFSKNQEDHQKELWDFIESTSTSEWNDILKNYTKKTAEEKENVPSN